MKTIRELHGGQLVISWILLLGAGAACVVVWFFSSASFDQSMQRAVDSSPHPRVVIDGLVFDDTTRTGESLGSESDLREKYAHEMLLSRGVPENIAAGRAREIATRIYYDSSRSYYDGIRSNYQRQHWLKSTYVTVWMVFAALAPCFALFITWVWLGGRARRNLKPD